MWSRELIIARGHGLAAPSTKLPRAAPLALLAGLPSLVRVLNFVWGVVAGSDKYDRIWLARSLPLLRIEIGR
jgi:hypothetical protein